jgi:hypothetical protein
MLLSCNRYAKLFLMLKESPRRPFRVGLKRRGNHTLLLNLERSGNTRAQGERPLWAVTPEKRRIHLSEISPGRLEKSTPRPRKPQKSGRIDIGGKLAESFQTNEAPKTIEQ